jgi:hypothetical protein
MMVFYSLFGEHVPAVVERAQVQKLNAFIYYFLVFAGVLG